MFNLYPDQVQAILIYIRHLDAAEKEIHEASLTDPPYIKPVGLTDNDGTDWGALHDEIGGAWSWKPPEAKP